MNFETRTYEEKMRLIRLQAKAQGKVNVSTVPTNQEEMHEHEQAPIRLGVQPVGPTMFVTCGALEQSAQPEYRIENTSSCFVIFFKQKTDEASRWRSLLPSTSCEYIWDDPTDIHTMLIRLGRNVLCPEGSSDEQSNDGNIWSSVKSMNCYGGVSSDSNKNTDALEIEFDKIGHKSDFPKFDGGIDLKVVITSEGPTRTLSILPPEDSIVPELQYCMGFATRQMKELEDLGRYVCSFSKTCSLDDHLPLDNQPNVVSSDEGDEEGVYSISPMISPQSCCVENSAPDDAMTDAELYSTINKKISNATSNLKLSQEELETSIEQSFDTQLPPHGSFNSLLGSSITGPNQLVLDILEARDLKPYIEGRGEDIYCTARLKKVHTDFGDVRGRWEFNKYRRKVTTDICQQTVDPVWESQRFIFSVPENAVQDS